MKGRLKHLLPKSKFARGVSVLAGGTASGQFIVVAVSPVLTRLYGPEDFGLLAVFAGLLGVLGIISSLCYQLAIPLPESDDDAASILVLSATIVLLITTITAGAVWFCSGDVGEMLHLPELSRYLWLLPFALFFAGVYQVLDMWAIRERAFGAITKTKVSQALSMTAVQLIASPLGGVGLLLGKAVQQAVGVVTLAKMTLTKRWVNIRQTSWRSVGNALARHRRFPIYSLWGNLANKVGVEIPALAFAVFFSTATAGFYALAHRVCAIPMSLIGRAVADAFYVEAAERARSSGLGELLKGVHDKLTLIALPPALTLFVAGPDIFVTVFGSQWRDAGVIARWLAPMLYAQFSIAPLIRVLMTIGEQKSYAALQVSMVVFRVSAIGFGIYLKSYFVAIVGYSFGSACIYLFYFVVLAKKCGISASKNWRATGLSLLWAVMLNLPPILAVALGASSTKIFSMVVLATGFIGVYQWVALKRSENKGIESMTSVANP